jgi:hypothetical protein
MEIWALDSLKRANHSSSNLTSSVLRCVSADDADEKSLAVAAARAMLPLSIELRRAVFPLIVCANAAVLVPLMPVAIENGDRDGIEQVRLDDWFPHADRLLGT